MAVAMNGRMISSHGYVKLLMWGHPNADSSGYVYEHRVVAERKLGRFLNPHEVVHHIDGDKQNNSPDNIMVLGSAAEHQVFHRKMQGRRLPGEANPTVMCGCGCGESFLKYDDSGRPRIFISGHNTIRKSRKLCECGCGEELSNRSGHFKVGHKGRNTGWKMNGPNPIVACACGCGGTFPYFDKYGRPRKYISGHN
jgi:hypothetical protein